MKSLIILVFCAAVVFGAETPEKFFTAFCAENADSTHTACATPNNPQNSGVSDEEKSKILKQHNYLRSHLKASGKKLTASNMQQMYWDDYAAYLAQKHADQCIWEHDLPKNRIIPGGMSLGQNMAIGGAKKISWEHFVNAWFNEEQNFKHGINKNYDKIGHYTQLTWASSNRLGCGYASCEIGGMYVCNYGPAGNTKGTSSKPYETGPAQCKMRKGLCDTKGKYCQDFGKVNVKDNSCDCPYTSQTGPNCEVDCSVAQDKKSCGKAPYTEGSCKAKNVPFMVCPEMCGICKNGKAVSEFVEGLNTQIDGKPWSEREVRKAANAAKKAAKKAAKEEKLKNKKNGD